MKGFNKIALIGWFFLLVVSIASASGNNLWEHFNGALPSLNDRAIIYNQSFPEKYNGYAEQNARLHSVLDGNSKLGALAFPPSTVEGTSTAGWTDSGSIVRLNTASDFVGIGTTNPGEKLTVQNGNFQVSGNVTLSGGTITFGGVSGTSTLTVANSGRLGIGSTTPQSTFSVQGSLGVSGTTTTGGLNATNTLTTSLTVTGTATSSFSGDINLPATKCFQINGTCVISSTAVSKVFYSSFNTTLYTENFLASTTLSIQIPGGTLSTGNVLVFTFYFNDFDKPGSELIYEEVGYGNASTTLNVSTGTAIGNAVGTMTVVLSADGASNAQNLSATLNVAAKTGGGTVASINVASTTAMAIDSTTNKVLNIVFNSPGANTDIHTSQIIGILYVKQ